MTRSSCQIDLRAGRPAATGPGRTDDLLINGLKPWACERYDIDPDTSAYLGNSLGGFFGVYVLLKEPATFQLYGLGSPLLWHHNHVIFEQEAAYAATQDDLAAKVMMSVGAYENPAGDRRHRDWLPDAERTAAEAEATAETDPTDMVTDVERMLGQLRDRSYPSLTIDSEVLPGEFHLTVTPLNLSRSLRFLFDAPR